MVDCQTGYWLTSPKFCYSEGPLFRRLGLELRLVLVRLGLGLVRLGLGLGLVGLQLAGLWSIGD